MLWPTAERWGVLSDLKGPDICNVHSNEAGYSLLWRGGRGSAKSAAGEGLRRQR